MDLLFLVELDPFDVFLQVAVGQIRNIFTPVDILLFERPDGKRAATSFPGKHSVGRFRPDGARGSEYSPWKQPTQTPTLTPTLTLTRALTRIQ